MDKKLENKLKKLNVAIVAHIFASGPALDLEQFLINQVASLYFIGHPFPYSEDARSFKRFYSKNKLLKTTRAPGIKLPEVLTYLKDAFLTLWWIWNSPRKIDLYIGSDGFVAFLGLLLKRFGKVQDVVLYTIDFMPTRFSNPVLNWLYHYFDNQCLRNCKVVWNLSEKMAEGREDYLKINRNNLVSQLTVPLGIWEKRIPKLSFEKRGRFKIVFMGHILKKQGIDIVIDALPSIKRKLPNAELLIIGTGDYEESLKRKVKKLHLEKQVQFSGYVEKHEDVEKMLSESMIAVATYKPDPESFTYFADPGKIKNYLAAGLPVILTDVPPIAKEIQKKKCAFITEYNSEYVAATVITLLSSPKILKEYSNNAVKYAKNFDWEIIFPNALEKTV